MADSKITGLAALTTADPANDMLPIVDVSDNSMAASGTTKRISINNILACSPSATLASATISGALDAARLNVTGATIPANGVYLGSANNLSFSAASTLAMTLNSTGLGVGGGPSASKVEVYSSNTGTSGLAEANALKVENNNATVGNAAGLFLSQSGNAGCGVAAIATSRTAGSRASDLALYYYNQSTSSSPIEGLRLNSSGNVGVGVTPSATDSTYFQALEIARVGQGLTAAKNALTGSPSSWLSNNSYATYSSGVVWNYAISQPAAQYRLFEGQHQWFNAPSGTAGNAITFTQAMTLDASGNLLVGTTTNTNNSRVFVRNGNASNPSLALQGITGDVGQAGLLVGKFDNDSTTSQILVRFTINNNAGGSGQINANGASQAAFGSYSDSRLKENIVSLPSQLASILSLRPVEFDYKDGSGHQIGFVAQEMQEVYSDAVGEQNGFLTVTGWSKTEARLVSAIKELAAKVQALEAKLA